MPNLSWRTRLIGLFALILGASLLFQVFYILPTIRGHQEETAKAHLAEIARSIAWELDADLLELESTLIEIAGRDEIRNLNVADQQQSVTQISNLSSGMSSLFVVDAEGWFVAGSAKDLSVYQKESYTDKPYYIATVEQGQTHFAAPRFYAADMIVSTSISVPIESDAGERIGLVMGTMSLNPMIEELTHRPLAEGTTVFMVDNEGTVVAHSEIDLFGLEEGPLSLNFSDRLLVQAIMAGGIGMGGEHDCKGTPHFGFYAILESNGWGVVVETPMSVILASTNVLSRQLLWSNIVLFVIALAITLIYSQRITDERKQAEKLLHESQSKLLKAQYVAGMGDFTWDIATDAVIWSDGMYRLLQYDNNESIDYNNINVDIHHPDDLERVTKWLMEGISSGEQFITPNEYRLIRKDGQIIHVQTNGQIEYQDGKAIRLFGTCLDITRRKQAEEELRESEAKYRRISENAPAVVYQFRMSPDREFTFPYINSAVKPIMGVTPEDVMRDSSNLIGTVHPEDQEMFLEGILKSAETLKPYHEMFRCLVDGKVVWVECLTTPAPMTDGSILWDGFFVDITERKQAEEERVELEEQLRQAQKMESIGLLAGGVAHDFNNMLSIILGYADIVHQQLHQDDPLREEVEQILKAGRSSAALTHQLLAFSRRQTLQLKVMDLNDIIHNTETMLHRLIREDIELELSLSRDLSHVNVDPRQIEHVIINLAVNALDAMPMGGKLLIETTEVELDQAYAKRHESVASGKYVMLTITDTGCGMDKEVLPQIFDPFFTTKEEGKGTGLGLATVYGIVKQSGGSIWANSEPGRGTTFKIYIPVTDDQPVAIAGEVAQEESSGRGERILVVEDEAALRGLLEAILSTLGYKVTLAENGREALLLMEEKELKPDLVITDVIMPGMSGSALVERLRRNQPDLKILFMSGYTDNVIGHSGVLDQETPFIQKPFTRHDIDEKIRALLRGE